MKIFPSAVRRRTRRAARQSGAATVEFALVAMFAFLPLLLGLLEIGRLFYVVTTTQEITRRAAREQVVRWMDQGSAIQRYAVFREAGSGSVALPGGPEINSADIRLEFYASYADALARTDALSGGSPEANVGNCIHNNSQCIRYVRASLETAAGPVRYRPMIGLFGSMFDVPLPGSTVIMPAESLGA